MDVAATDYHTAGEPFRIVTAGVPEIAGATVRDRRERAMRSDAIERAGRRRVFAAPPANDVTRTNDEQEV